MIRAPSRLAAGGGALGGAAMLAVLLVGSAISGQQGFLEIVHNGATAFVPLSIFEAGISTFGSYAKGLLFIGEAIVLVLAGSALAAILARAGFLSRRPSWIDAAWLGVLAWALAELVVLPIFGAGFLGMGFVGDVAALHAPLIVGCAAYGLVTVGVVRERGRAAVPAVEGDGSAAASPDGIPRRSFVGGIATAVGLLALGIGSIGVLSRVLSAAKPTPVSPFPPEALEGFGPTTTVTPIDDFYTVSKDLFPTRVDGATWRLALTGLVDAPRDYTMEDLRAMPRVEGYRTLQCISNEIVTYGALIGNQRWAGVRFADVLDAVRVQPAATHVLWRSADGYTESLPLDAARDPRTWLVDEMGPPGTALTQVHGYPLRVLIAGRYGMKQPKWLTGIEIADHDELGFWEQRGWDQTAAVRTYSRIDSPRDFQTVPAAQPLRISGVASAGDRGIARVEVSTDDGTTWTDAEIEEVATGIGDLTWRRWRADLPLPGIGRYVLRVRATDGIGGVQDGTARPTLPSGATGWHRVTISAT